MKPPLFVDERIAELEQEMVFGKTKFLRKSAKELRDRYDIEKQSEQISRFLSNVQTQRTSSRKDT
jgi:hypothetical protein